MSRRSRLGVLGVMWKVLRGTRRAGGPGLGARFRSVPRMVAATVTRRYRGLGWGRLAGMVLAVLYLVSPVDLVPEAFLGLVGLADDVAVAAWLAAAVLVETDQFLDWERSQPRVVRGSVVG
ncbi:MAG TPA: YkvA family protein [Candidatus Eisenbacteria bacterium]|nr:YkvA family protein [Candidatus Eisenbacteria bacterium]